MKVSFSNNSVCCLLLSILGKTFQQMTLWNIFTFFGFYAPAIFNGGAYSITAVSTYVCPVRLSRT